METREVGLSVSTLQAFMLAPEANELLETVFFSSCLGASTAFFSSFFTSTTSFLSTGFSSFWFMAFSLLVSTTAVNHKKESQQKIERPRKNFIFVTRPKICWRSTYTFQRQVLLLYSNVAFLTLRATSRRERSSTGLLVDSRHEKLSFPIRQQRCSGYRS